MNSFLELLIQFFLNTSVYSSSQFRVKKNLRKKNLLAGRPHFPIAHQATQEYRRSGVLKTSLQADPRHTKGEKKATVLMVSLMSPGTGGRRSL